MDKVRQRLMNLARERKLSFREMSLAIGKSHSYIQQFVEYEKPKILPESVRLALANYLKVSETELRDGLSGTAPRGLPVISIPLNTGDIASDTIEQIAREIVSKLEPRVSPADMAWRLRRLLDQIAQEKAGEE